jgi:hypothetical protein
MISKLFITITLCSSAHARKEHKDDYDNFNSDGEDYQDFNSGKNDPYRDWNSVLSLLASKGVDSNKINWGEVESSCQQIANSSDIQLNKCKYENAVRYNKYQNDATYCTAEANQKYYKFGANERNAYDFKNSVYITCMRKIGWSDPESWIGGKNTQRSGGKNYIKR